MFRRFSIWFLLLRYSKCALAKSRFREVLQFGNNLAAFVAAFPTVFNYKTSSHVTYINILQNYYSME